MTKNERDLLIHQILRGDTFIPENVSTATYHGDPDLYAMRLIVELAYGDDPRRIAMLSAVASATHPEHTLLNLTHHMALAAIGNPTIVGGWIAMLASDEMGHEITGKIHAAA
jgi:hypothetical protein